MCPIGRNPFLPLLDRYSGSRCTPSDSHFSSILLRINAAACHAKGHATRCGCGAGLQPSCFEGQRFTLIGPTDGKGRLLAHGTTTCLIFES